MEALKDKSRANDTFYRRDREASVIQKQRTIVGVVDDDEAIVYLYRVQDMIARGWYYYKTFEVIQTILP